MENTYRAILEINKMIGSESELPAVLRLILQHALALSGAESAAIILQKENGKYDIAAHKNISEENWNADFSRAFANDAINNNKIVESDDAMSDERFSLETSVRNLKLRSVICLPIHARGRVMGALYLDSRSKLSAFKDTNKDALRAFADQVGIAIDRAREYQDLSLKSVELKDQLEEMETMVKKYEDLLEKSVHGFPTHLKYENIVGCSKQMSDILETINKIAETDISIFLTGPEGSGKELIALTIHEHSKRKNNRFVAQNCGSMPAGLIEEELFGIKAGVESGKPIDRTGLLEDASGGTLFLNEVTALPLAIQERLMKTKEIHARIISATSGDIEKMLSEKTFREDLYWKLGQIRIDIPALKDRREDIPLLVKHFLAKNKDKHLTISPKLLKIFMEYDWPGNVRELENLVSVAASLAEGNTIDEKCIPSNYNLTGFPPHHGAGRE